MKGNVEDCFDDSYFKHGKEKQIERKKIYLHLII